MVAGGTGDDALGPLLNGELGDHVACAPELEGAGVLKIFGLQIQVTVGGDARCLGQGGGADDILQNHGSVEDLVDGHHSDLSFNKNSPVSLHKETGLSNEQTLRYHSSCHPMGDDRSLRSDNRIPRYRSGTVLPTETLPLGKATPRPVYSPPVIASHHPATL